MTVTELETALVRLGCPREKARFMAEQLDRRARMDAERKAVSYDAALQHLIGLLAQGWAAQKRPG